MKREVWKAVEFWRQSRRLFWRCRRRRSCCVAALRWAICLSESGSVRLLILSLAVFVGLGFQRAVNKIALKNPSFEDTPGPSRVPQGWTVLGRGSTPDIMPGAWGVQAPPREGESFLALVTRRDGTVEDIAQLLSTPLQPGVCYAFSIYLAHAPKYVGSDLPVRLRLWSSDGTQKLQLLGSSPLITHSEWRQYDFQFVPKQAVRYFVLEAYYAPGVLRPYAGNLLLDSCSAIERCERA